jgi:hypothetical protein
MGTHHTNVLKIHGDLSTPEEIVLTRTDYDRYFEHRPAVATLLRGLLLNRTFVFIGYSLRDPNLNIILNEVRSLLKDARRPCYAIVFEATEEEVRNCKDQGIFILRLLGETSTQKTIFLWQFLDLLQMKYFSSQGAWLAPDSIDFLPADIPLDHKQILESLKTNLTNLALKVINHQTSSEMIDFAMPFLALGAKHGLTLNTNVWEIIAAHYKNKKPSMESDLILSMASTIEALEQSCGKGEQKYLDEIDNIQKRLFM